MQENQLGRRELIYRGSAVPSSPLAGNIWRELDSSGRWVNDWQFLGGLWLSREALSTVLTVNVNGGSATYNGPVGASPGTWAYFVEGYLCSSNSTDTWSIDVRHARLRLANTLGYVALETLNSTANTFWNFTSGWWQLDDAYSINLPLTRTGTGSLYGNITTTRRKIR